MPEISADGKTWTIRVRKGIYFADDPVFKGQRRELTAADYVFAIKRILDPRMRSNSLQMVDGRFVGADALVAKAKETGRFDYDAPLEGLQAIDRYTLQFKLVFPDYELLSNLTTTALSAVAREVIEAYGDENGWAMANPVGTGAYRLKEWRRGQRIVLEANPGYRDERYPGARRRGRSAARERLDRPQAAARSHASRSASSRKRSRDCSRSSRSSSTGWRCRRISCRRCSTPTTGSNAELAKAGVRARARRPAGDRVHVLQHGRSRRRRLHAGRRSRCAARSSWATTSTRRSA